MSKTDKELLELAAKAVGIETNKARDGDQTYCYDSRDGVYKYWSPLTDDGDALRLAVDLGLDIVNIESSKEVAIWTNRALLDVYQKIYNDKHAATRRAIVRAAASIGEAMQ